MEEALKQSSTRFATGQIVKGTVIEVRPKEVLVDIGYKSEGVISGNEFDDIKAVKIGDEVDVLIEKLEDKEGMVVLSKEKAEFKKNWDKILTICNEGGTITGKVKAAVKGGLLVNIGVEAFLRPASLPQCFIAFKSLSLCSRWKKPSNKARRALPQARLSKAPSLKFAPRKFSSISATRAKGSSPATNSTTLKRSNPAMKSMS